MYFSSLQWEDKLYNWFTFSIKRFELKYTNIKTTEVGKMAQNTLKVCVFQTEVLNPVVL
jgi:hypothetical protein